MPDLANSDGRIVTIRVDTGVVAETDSDNSRSDENRWMRLTLDPVGSVAWPQDRQGRPVYPEGFQDFAVKLGRALHPPGRDVRCIVSVGMLTEGWDCNTVTHVIGLRPFQSQLLCERAAVRSFAKNQGLQFVVSYLHNGEVRDYVPDFIARLETPDERYLIVETKGADWPGTAEVKAQAAHRWCDAVNAIGRFGHWNYLLAWSISDLVSHLDRVEQPGS